MDDLNKLIFSFASYNAGPGRVKQLRQIAAERGYNPNVWFGNVERMASEKIGSETVTYVSNIYKYYLAYSLILEEKEAREKAKQQPPLRRMKKYAISFHGQGSNSPLTPLRKGGEPVLEAAREVSGPMPPPYEA